MYIAKNTSWSTNKQGKELGIQWVLPIRKSTFEGTVVDRRERIERDILGAILGRPQDFQRCKMALLPKYFRNPLWRKVIQAIGKCAETNIDISIVNVCNYGRLNPSEQSQFFEIEPSGSSDLRLLTRVLAECTVESLVIDFKASVSPGCDTFVLLDRIRELQESTFSVIHGNIRTNKTDLLSQYSEYLLTNYNSDLKRIATPFPTLNRMLNGGLEPGGFTLLGGTPGSGKTSLMLSLALHAAENLVKVVFLEGEMTANEIFERLNGISTGADIASIRNGTMYEEHSREFISTIHNLPIEIIPLYDRSLGALTSEIQAQANEGVKLMFVDYLQVFTSKLKATDEFFEIKRTSERLRALALFHGVHLFVATSLNRNDRKSDRRTLDSFYGSSGLGHDCSIGLILSGQQSDLQELKSPERPVVLQVVKNRSGVRGDIALRFYLRSQQFDEV